MNTTNTNQRITAAAVRSNLARTYTTITEAATELGISRSTLSRKVNGHTPWSLNDLLWLKEHYGLSYEFVIDGAPQCQKEEVA